MIKCDRILTVYNKYKKYFRIIFVILSIYFLLIIFVKKIETIATFPGTFVNVQDVVGHIETNINFEEINIDDGKGNNINGLYLEGKNGKTVYYFHGNGGPLSYFYSEIKYINELGYNVISYDYPGYGKSESYPYKKNVDNFSQIFYNFVKKDKNINNKDLIVWGYSVGTAVATDFASKNIFDKLVLVSPFASRYDMSKKIFGFNFSKLIFLSNSYNTKNLVKNFDKPVLIIHGNKDKIVSFNQGKEVFKNYRGNKNFIEIDNFGHNYIIDYYGKSLSGFFLDFLNGKELNFKKNYLFLDNNKKIKLEEKNKNLLFLNNFDLKTDNSITKFVNSKVSFNNKKYIPENLEKISSDYIYDTKGGIQKLRKIANYNLQELAKSFKKEFGIKLKVVSAYRSYAYQKGIKDRGCPDNLCAKAGYSEHQSGLTIDVFEASSKYRWENNLNLKKYYKWLNENAHKFGFHNTYQKGLEIDGYEIEPWHFRYLGIELASYLKENNMTIAEFYNKK